MKLQAVGMATETTITTNSGFTAAKAWFDSWVFNSPLSAALNVYCQTGNFINMNDHSKSVKGVICCFMASHPLPEETCILTECC